jgi:uncharacterized membrane protein YgaE (UPF0421/DUF939 family)
MAFLPDRTTLRQRFSTEWPQIVRVLIAAIVSWLVCKLIDTSAVPIFAVVAPLVAMRDQPFSALNVSFDRLIGVVVGVVLGIVVVNAFGLSLLSVATVLVVGLLSGVVLRIGPVLNIQVALTGLLVFTSIDPATYGITRLWETLIGAAVTVVLSPFLLPPDAAKQYRLELRRVCVRLSEHLAQAGALVEDAPRNHEALEALHEAAQRTQASAQALPGLLDSARRAVRNNPLRRRDIAPLETLATPTTTVVEMARWVRLLVEEVTDLSGRPDVDPVWATSGTFLSRVLRPLAAVIDAVLVKDTGDAASVQEAADELHTWRESDKHPLAVVMRRPVYRLLRVVATLTGEPLPNVPHDIRDHVGGDLVGETPTEGGSDRADDDPR